MKKAKGEVSKETWYAVGMMSGTSCDGVDLAILEIPKEEEFKISKESIIFCKTYPYPSNIKTAIHGVAFGSNSGTTKELCMLNTELGRFYSQLIVKGAQDAKISRERILVIGSHGQIVYHIPPERKKEGGYILTLGDTAVISTMTGITTVGDFRAADITAGGEGAPLLPHYLKLLFQGQNQGIGIQNIGGISSLTVINPKEEEILAFDTGPGNALIDEAMRMLTNGQLEYDPNGSWASRGIPNTTLAQTLLNHPYFRKSPPKSTGKDVFGKEFLQQKMPFTSKPYNDIATITYFTALSIADSIKKFVIGKDWQIDELLLCGGGIKNKTLVTYIEQALQKMGLNIKVQPINNLGIDGSFLEAQAFACYAVLAIKGTSINIKTATGAAKEVICGKIAPGANWDTVLNELR